MLYFLLLKCARPTDNIYYYKCDVSDWEQVQAAAKKLKEEVSACDHSSRATFDFFFQQLGDPTVIINNAGVVQGKLLLDLTAEDVKQ